MLVPTAVTPDPPVVMLCPISPPVAAPAAPTISPRPLAIAVPSPFALTSVFVAAPPMAEES